MTRSEYCAYRIAQRSICDQVDHFFLLCLLVAFSIGLFFGYRIGRAKGLW